MDALVYVDHGTHIRFINYTARKQKVKINHQDSELDLPCYETETNLEVTKPIIKNCTR